MAITINSTPENYASMHDALYHVVTSNNVLQTDFKYVFDIRINNNLVTRLKIFPDPSQKGILNASNVIRNYATSTFKPNSTQALLAYTGNDFYIDYVIQFGEEYGGTTYTNLASGTYRAYNTSAIPMRDYGSSYLQNYVNKLLTQRDKLQFTQRNDEKLYVTYFRDASGTMAITIDNGVTSTTGTSLTMQTFTLFDISPNAINAYLTTNFVTSFQDYIVTIGTEVIRVNRICSKFDTTSIHFLNDLGGYDTFHFRLVNKQTRDIDRKKFSPRLWELSGNSMVRYDTFKRMYGGSRTYAVNETIGYRLTSDYINQTDWEWMAQLFSSPEVYIEIGGYYYPCVIKETNWEQKLRISDKLINVTMNVEVTMTNSQYR